ncbi:hypothetical protein ACIRNI_24195 [Streptomyces sp. NPDC093546]|uniref:hypothetical protein n=1 Tax=Streptomyces sp. NPDC093546 TaxID=3366040 RepID=UPI0038091C66
MGHGWSADLESALVAVPDTVSRAIQAELGVQAQELRMALDKVCRSSEVTYRVIDALAASQSSWIVRSLA